MVTGLFLPVQFIINVNAFVSRIPIIVTYAIHYGGKVVCNRHDEIPLFVFLAEVLQRHSFFALYDFNTLALKAIVLKYFFVITLSVRNVVRLTGIFDQCRKPLSTYVGCDCKGTNYTIPDFVMPVFFKVRVAVVTAEILGVLKVVCTGFNCCHNY